MKTNDKSTALFFNYAAWNNANDYAAALAWFMLNHVRNLDADAVELSACVDTGDGNIERMSAEDAQAAIAAWIHGDARTACPVFFSLYWRVGVRAECFADLRSMQDARVLAYYIAERHALELLDNTEI